MTPILLKFILVVKFSYHGVGDPVACVGERLEQVLAVNPVGHLASRQNPLQSRLGELRTHHFRPLPRHGVRLCLPWNRENNSIYSCTTNSSCSSRDSLLVQFVG